jgi:DNA-binding response OmpR family regulator
MRILLIEDNTEEADMIKRGLIEDSHAVDLAFNAAEGEDLAAAYPYDLIILDLNLPDRDGVELCREIRDKKNKSRILMLTGRDSVKDRVRGLNSGADDYLVKPFDFDELSARVRALSRRDVIHGSPVLRYGILTLNTATREVKCGEKVIGLTNKEYAILIYFMQNPEIVITRRMLEDHIWNYSLDSSSNIIDVHLSRIRSKLGAAGEHLFIPVYGVGYKLNTA